MRPLILASLLVFASATAAWAQCVSRPDDASSGYTANQTALAVCRQMELGDSVRDGQLQQQIDAQMRQLEQLRLNDQLNRAQAALPTIPVVPAIPSF